MSTEAKQIVVTPPEAPKQDGMAAMMERLALNPDLPVDKLRELLNMQIEIRAIEAEREYSAAMARVQSALPVVLKDAYNDQTRSPYATVSAIAAAIKPVYTREGFSISFSEAKTEKPDHVRVRATVRHRDGHKDESPFVDVAVDKTGLKGNDNKTLTHAEGSSFTYGRRYLTCMIFDVATGLDTDGNGQKPKGEPISEQQAADLNALLDEVKADRVKFLKWCQVESIEDIPAKWYKTCVNQLESKRK
jgi:hypothetical protein